ncbi:MAG: hypothetical protein P8Z79_01610 [Sedimentisphaerales bacterium]
MKLSWKIFPALLLMLCASVQRGQGQEANRSPEFDLQSVLELRLGEPTGQLRAVPVDLGKGPPKAILAVHCPDAEVDPYVEMFFFPKGALKLTLFTMDGKILWRRDLGPGVVPGIWFTPVYPFDLDGDGVDEIWFINNIDPDHPLSINNRRLERIDPLTNKTTGRWPWPRPVADQRMSHTFRNFILGGYVRGTWIWAGSPGSATTASTSRWPSASARRPPGRKDSSTRT